MAQPINHAAESDVLGIVLGENRAKITAFVQEKKKTDSIHPIHPSSLCPNNGLSKLGLSSHTIVALRSWCRKTACTPPQEDLLMAFKLKVNGAEHEVNVDGDIPLLWVLRDVLGMTGTKFGCGKALCGACTVHVNGLPMRSCAMPVGSVGDSAVTTIEAIGETPIGQRLQKAWLDLEVVQCGYCQPGQIMSAAALLAANSKPTDGDINTAMSGNICRCGTYIRIREAIKQAAQASVPPMP
jgi:isoquinoline 1-oxidoreductase alpha subunit